MARETHEAYIARKRLFVMRRRIQHERDARQAKLAPVDAITLYRAEKAAAERRWKRTGGPVGGRSSGRHPIVRGRS